MESSDVVTAEDVTEDSVNILFSPPLYQQRYNLAASILQEAKITSVCLCHFSPLAGYFTLLNFSVISGLDLRLGLGLSFGLIGVKLCKKMSLHRITEK